MLLTAGPRKFEWQTICVDDRMDLRQSAARTPKSSLALRLMHIACW